MTPAATTAGPTLKVDRRYAGPTGLGNGGYACGLFASEIEGPAAVTLRNPVPLDQDLTVETDGDGLVSVADRDRVIAEVSRSRPLTGLEPPVRPDPVQASAASVNSAFDGPGNPFPHCFVCGPDHTGGLRLHAGPITGFPGVQAAPFTPAADLPGRNEGLAPEIVWSALDCPSLPGDRVSAGVPHLLGRLTAELLAPVPYDRPSVVVGWQIGTDGRKLHTAGAVLSEDGEILARARALWIALRSEQASQFFPPTHRRVPNENHGSDTENKRRQEG